MSKGIAVQSAVPFYLSPIQRRGALRMVAHSRANGTVTLLKCLFPVTTGGVRHGEIKHEKKFGFRTVEKIEQLDRR